MENSSLLEKYVFLLVVRSKIGYTDLLTIWPLTYLYWKKNFILVPKTWFACPQYEISSKLRRFFLFRFPLVVSAKETKFLLFNILYIFVLFVGFLIVFLSLCYIIPYVWWDKKFSLHPALKWWWCIFNKDCHHKVICLQYMCFFFFFFEWVE